MTDNDKMREEFETWAERGGHSIAKYELPNNNDYWSDFTQFAWEAWQAAKSVPVVGDYPVSVSYTEYLHLAGEDWDDDYKTIWAKLQAEVETKILWRKFAKSLCSSSITRAELDALRKDAERYRWLRDNKSHTFSVSRDDLQKPNYMTAEEFINDDPLNDFTDFGDTEELKRMVESDTIWRLQVYPDTPIGFCVWHGSSLDYVVDEAIYAAIAGEKK